MSYPLHPFCSCSHLPTLPSSLGPSSPPASIQDVVFHACMYCLSPFVIPSATQTRTQGLTHPLGGNFSKFYWLHFRRLNSLCPGIPQQLRPSPVPLELLRGSLHILPTVQSQPLRNQADIPRLNIIQWFLTAQKDQVQVPRQDPQCPALPQLSASSPCPCTLPSGNTLRRAHSKLFFIFGHLDTFFLPAWYACPFPVYLPAHSSSLGGTQIKESFF